MNDTAFDWEEPAQAAAKKPSKKPVRVKPPAVKAKKRGIETASKISRPAVRGKAMFQAVSGRKRIWACDGEYVFFRRKSCIDPTQPGLVHAAITRHEKFLRQGEYTYVETQDDVEICRVNENSAFHRKGGVYLGQMSEGGLNRVVCIAACKRDWTLYADALEELAGRIKGKWQTQGQATVCWNEHLAYIDHLVSLRGGPTPAERGAGLANVRAKRGEGRGKVILLPQ
jgi:hypothetical protein